MRGYECYVSTYVDGKLTPSYHHACWAMLMDGRWYDGMSKCVVPTLSGKDIYIDKFDDPATAPHQGLLLALVNEITPCHVVTFGGWFSSKRYIKFRMLDGYERSLVLLNFIRNLWHQPVVGYTKAFFDALADSHNHYTDPLARLTWANKQTCANVKCAYGSPGHSNVHFHTSLHVKTKDRLLNDAITSATYFLCTP